MSDSEKKPSRSGTVSIVGRPNVGKSTLLNAIIGEKVTIVSKVPQTTRNKIRAIYTDDQGQIIFLDTPGLHLGGDKLDKYMNQSSSGALHDIDCVIYLVDTTRRIGEEEASIAQKIKALKVPVIYGLNKIDQKSADVPSYIAHWEKVKGQSVSEMKNFEMIALSGKKEINVDKLIDVAYTLLPEGPHMYPDDVITDMPQKMTISDIIREKLLNALKDELPHSVAVVVEGLQPRKGKTIWIKALIYVERETQKEIVIGKNGSMLKKIGSFARAELEVLLESKVFLEMHVKTQKGWRDKIGILQELGYDGTF